MAALTIGGQVRELRLRAVDIVKAEERIMKSGGRPILAAVATKSAEPYFAIGELEWLVWGAWRHTCSDERVRLLLAQWYAEGGTFFELHTEVLNALLESGTLVKRAPPTADTPDPQAAGMSG